MYEILQGHHNEISMTIGTDPIMLSAGGQRGSYLHSATGGGELHSWLVALNLALIINSGP